MTVPGDRPPAASPDLPVIGVGGEVAQYQVTRLLGRGGMGEVYEARDTHLGRKVALKVIRPEVLGDREAREMFLREARLTARLSHPHIVAIFGAGEHGGCPYVALEYLKGQTLRERLDETRLSFKEALRVGRAIADALAEAHRNDILHRDLKPQNILLPADGRLRVLDFGLAKLLSPGDGPAIRPLAATAPVGPATAAAAGVVGETLPLGARPPCGSSVSLEQTLPVGASLPTGPGADLDRTLAGGGALPPGPDALLASPTVARVATSELPAVELFETRVGGIRGTPAYMAPEQWLELPVSRATDTWALGVILYELIGGRHPFAGSSIARLCTQVTGGAAPPSLATACPEAPRAVTELVDRCLQRDPEVRPSALQVREVLDEHLAGADRRLVESPFRGLLPFAERHAALFHGRDQEVAAFLERMREEPVLPVVGPSGGGKSSFVQAGVIPRLRDQGAWLVLRLRPGKEPFAALASRLLAGESTVQGGATPISSPDRAVEAVASGSGDPTPPAIAPERAEDEHRLARELEEAPARLALHLAERARDRHVLLFVDQIEELYTLAPRTEGAASTRRRFMQALAAAADDPEGPVRVVFTLRDDFLGRLAESEEARQALSRVTVLRPPGPEALQEILEKSVIAAGHRWEDPALPAEMVREVRGEIAALPLLQFAGQQLWERRNRETRVLTRSAYAELGGVVGALAQHADGILAGLTPTQEQSARRLLLRLVTADGTRQVLPRRRLLEGLGPEADAVLERLVAGRVVLIHKGREEAELELVHESLILTWGRLVRWLDDSREERQFLTEVGQAAELWDRRGRSEAEVWQGEALTAALVRARRCVHLPEAVQRFLAAGELRARRAVRRRRVAWALGLGALALVALGSVVFSLVVVRQKHEVGRHRDRAERRKQEAEVQRGHAEDRRAAAEQAGARAALLRGDPFEARTRLRLALEIRDAVPARSLVRRLGQDPLVWKQELSATVYAVAFAPDGRTVAAACEDHSVYLLDARTRVARVLRGHRGMVLSVAFSPEGRTVASGDWNGEIRLWDVATGQSRSLLGHQDGIRSLAFGPAGDRLASGSYDTTVRVWDVPAAKAVAVLRGHRAIVNGVAFDRAGRRVASASDDGTVRVWEASTSRELAVLRGAGPAVWGVSFSPQGDRLASAGYDAVVRLWDPDAGREVAALRGHDSAILGVAYGPTGDWLVSAGYDRKVLRWDVRTGRPSRVLRGHQAGIRALALSRSGSHLVTGSYDRTVRLWDVSAGTAPETQEGHQAGVLSVAFHPDGRTLASGSDDRTVRLWDAPSGEPVAVISGHDASVNDVAFLGRGERLVTASGDETIRVWDVSTGRSTAVLRGHGASVSCLAATADGERLASGSSDRTVRLWDLRSGQTTAVLRGHEASVRSVAFGPTGDRLASSSDDRTVRIWEARTGQALGVLRGHEARVYKTVFRPPGLEVASGSYDGTVRLWNVATGAGRVAARHPGRVYGLDAHPDGQRLGVPSADGTIRLVDLGTGRFSVLSGHRAEVSFFRFSPDGALAASGSLDGTIHLWDVRQGRPAWRAPLLRPRELTLLTHRGWVQLGTGTIAAPAPSAWRRAVEERGQTAAESDVAPLLCLVTAEGIEIWDLATDRLRSREPLAGITRVVALPGACVTLAETVDEASPGRVRRGVVRLHAAEGRSRTLREHASALAWTGTDLLVAAGPQVHVHGPEGQARASHAVSPGATAVGQAGGLVVLGFGDGNLELVPLDPEQPRPRFFFEDVSASPVVALAPGPGGTVLAGFGNGRLGLWSLADGALLESARLHGPVVHLRAHGTTLWAATELGRYLRWDLSVYHVPYCDLLRELWRMVPIVWEQGVPVERGPPPGHRCRR